MLPTPYFLLTGDHLLLSTPLLTTHCVLTEGGEVVFKRKSSICE